MEVLLFKTDIKSKKKVKAVSEVFQLNSIYSNWSIDTEDIDRVLRMESKENLKEADVVNLLRAFGFYCEILKD